MGTVSDAGTPVAARCAPSRRASRSGRAGRGTIRARRAPQGPPAPRCAAHRARRPPISRILPLFTLLASAPFHSFAVAAQTPVTVQPAGENLRNAPSGGIVGFVTGSTRLTGGAPEGDWRPVELEGWIWALSVGPTGAGSLQVDPAGGENLRDAPNGRVLARLERGAVLEEVRRDGRWVRVRRRAWMWSASVREAAPERRSPSATAEQSPRGEAGEVANRPRAGDVGEAAPGRVLTVGPADATLRGAPEDSAIGSVRAGTQVSVVERRGEWARVRVEGWLRAPEVGQDSTAPSGDVTVQDLADHPERYEGTRLRWTVQFIALERAERIRTEFYAGEPYLLARGPGEDRPIVYLAVPPELMERAERLEPLDRIEVVGRVRTPRSPLTGAPVLDLQEIR